MIPHEEESESPMEVFRELDRLRSELEKADGRLQRVQRALAFWHPGVRVDGVSEEMTERAANDAMLIFGLEDADEQSAIDLGWIHWVIPGENGRLRRELAEAQRDAARYRWLRSELDNAEALFWLAVIVAVCAWAAIMWAQP